MASDQKNVDLRWRIYCAVVIMISLAIQFYVTRCGLLLTQDSLQYISAARSFAENNKFIGTDGSPYVFWPPLFPLILSFFDNPAAAMIWINLILSGATGVLLARLASQHLSDIRFRLGFLIAWMLGVHQLLISVFLWSELIFLLLLLGFTEAVILAVKSRTWLIVAFVLGLLLCLQRNAGLFIVPAAAAWFLLTDENRAISFWRAGVILLSTLGGIWWNVTNMFGSIKTSVSDLDYLSFVLDNVMVVTDGIAKSVLPFTILSIPIAIAVIATPLVLIWPSRTLSDHFLLIALICCFYLGGMAVMFRLDPGDADRYAAVILPFLLLMIFRIIEIVYSKPDKLIRAILLAGIICWLLYPLGRTARNAMQWHDASCTARSE